jgi:hypothetical protein
MKLLALSGKKQSGKDTVCFLLRSLTERPVIRLAFADALKEEAASVLGISVTELDENKERFRPFLQWWGTEWRRANDPRHWVRVVEARIAEMADKDVLVAVTDARFPDEAECIRALGGRVVNVVRPDSCSRDTHSSETSMAYFPFDGVILNNGTLDDLRNSARVAAAGLL